jgi:hypothetical protein
VGKPRLRWLEDLENDSGELKVNTWRQKANKRDELASVLKGATVLGGPYSQGVSK